MNEDKLKVEVKHHCYLFFGKKYFQVSSPSSAQPTSALPFLVFLIQMLFYDSRWTQSLRCAHCNAQWVVHIAHCNVHKMCAHIALPFRNRIGHIKESLDQFCRMWLQSCKFLRPFQSVSESCGFIGPGTFNNKASNDRMFQKIFRQRFMNKNVDIISSHLIKCFMCEAHWLWVWEIRLDTSIWS